MLTRTRLYRLLTFPLAITLLSVSFAFESIAAQNTVPKWERFELNLESATAYDNPVQEASLTATFTSPKGIARKVYGFWDGGKTWHVRFSPNETGRWTYKTICSDANNKGLNNQSGEFMCGEPSGKTRFTQHGPIRVSEDQRSLAHEDGTPFFYMGDTAWNGPLLSTPADWQDYIKERTRQKFSVVQWVATQWRAAPMGDRENRVAYRGGVNRIEIIPAFFQALDQKAEALSKAGLLNVPVMLWAIASGGNPKVNPGVSLPDDQAILLARYMVARWGDLPVMWILAGDGDYRGPKADRWKKIGRAVFGDVLHGPVTMHPGGMQWVWEEFKDEPWYDVVGYQSGHSDDDKTLRWMTEGPPTVDWMRFPNRPFINLEAPYENHLAYSSKKPITPETTRRAMYWTLLNNPPAGVTYGGHGVWGWDDGTRSPTDHEGTGTPLPWKKALTMPGAEQVKNLVNFFNSVDFSKLRPTPVFVVNQPGASNPSHYVAAARTDNKELMVVYIPEDRTIEIKLDALPPSPNISWISPKTGEKTPAVAVVTANTCQFPTPSEGDWILLMTSNKKDKESGSKTNAPAAKPK
jgi:Protein of unknown function (DUF4038)/Domain of unknown function (DUF5060)/Putative collagen-binding domain of a collagenase